jgi:hypothetical protein
MQIMLRMRNKTARLRELNAILPLTIFNNRCKILES